MNNVKQINNVREGGIIINMLPERFLIFSRSWVSKYIQIIASKDVNGIEATIPAMIVDLLDISETTTTMSAVNNTFKKIYI